MRVMVDATRGTKPTPRRPKLAAYSAMLYVLAGPPFLSRMITKTPPAILTEIMLATPQFE
jgi:hypothetical protein